MEIACNLFQFVTLENVLSDDAPMSNAIKLIINAKRTTLENILQTYDYK